MSPLNGLTIKRIVPPNGRNRLPVRLSGRYAQCRHLRLLTDAAIAVLVAAFVWFPPSVARAAEPVPIASYTIEVTLDADAKTLTGHEVITYVNTTDVPIPDLVFHLYLNAFRSPDTLFLQESGVAHRGNRWDPEHPGWIRVSDIRLQGGPALALDELADGTLARAALPQPVAPGSQVVIELDFEALLPRVFARTGYVDNFFMVGQWFPKLGVWESMPASEGRAASESGAASEGETPSEEGWNAYPFHANAEFYADFGEYDVQITLPSSYVIGATGVPVSSVDHDDGSKTVRYVAEHVIDFAWTACPRFEEAVREVLGAELRYLYLTEHAWSVERAMDTAEAAFSAYSDWYGPYPYSRLTIVDVPDDAPGAGGMEYPMLVTAGATSMLGTGDSLIRAGADRSLEVVIAHEIGHQWWQSVVAFNEAEEPWLDEGFTDYSTLRVMERTYGANSSVIDTRSLDIGYLDVQRLSYAVDPRLPMARPAWEFDAVEYGIAVYTKPLLSLRTLERTLGEPVILDIMSTFFQRYRFAHPNTENFRAVAEEVAGQNLDWFFDGLVYGDGVLNYAVTEVDTHSVTAVRQGELAIPTEILVTFADGSTAIELWSGQEERVTLTYPDRPPVASASIDPEHKIALDLRWADNGLSREFRFSTWAALVSRLVHSLQSGLLLLGGL